MGRASLTVIISYRHILLGCIATHVGQCQLPAGASLMSTQDLSDERMSQFRTL